MMYERRKRRRRRRWGKRRRRRRRRQLMRARSWEGRAGHLVLSVVTCKGCGEGGGFRGRRKRMKMVKRESHLVPSVPTL